MNDEGYEQALSTRAKDARVAKLESELARLSCAYAEAVDVLKGFVALDECEAHIEDGFERLIPRARSLLSRIQRGNDGGSSAA